MAGPSTPAGRSHHPGCCGESPQTGSAETVGSAAGEGFPQSALVLEDHQPQTTQDHAGEDDHPIKPYRPRAAEARAPAQTSGRLDHAALRRDMVRRAKVGIAGSPRKRLRFCMDS